jgi:tetratricopeptide (TPR) repeat protein
MLRSFQSLVIQILALWKNLLQKQVGARVGLDEKATSRVLKQAGMDDDLYQRMLERMNARPAEVAVVTGALEALDALDQDNGLSEAERDRIESAVLEAQRIVRNDLIEAARLSRNAPPLDGYPEPDHVEPARWQARQVWPLIEKLSASKQEMLVRHSPQYQTWAFMELVCEKSVEEASRDPQRAAGLARLATVVAETVRGPEGWCKRVKGYALAHVPNIERVFGRLEAADAALAEAGRLWLTGSDPDRILDPGRLLDLEASLRRAQRRFDEALACLAGAEAVGRRRDRYLVNRGFAFEVMGKYEQAMVALLEAQPLVEQSGDERLLYMQRYNLAVVYTHLGRFSEASGLLRLVRPTVVEREDKSEAIRIKWLEGRIAAGLGRRDEALKLLTKAQEEFGSRKMWYDVALCLLEIAILLLESGNAPEVKALAHDLAKVFEAQGVHHEALVALQLFQEATVKEVLTVAQARRILDYLFMARYNPDLRYES